MPSSNKLTILQLNDSHGYLEPHPELFWSGSGAAYRTAGGFSRIASLMEGAREDEVLAFDCGDTIHGTYLPVKTRGKVMVPVLNALKFKAMTAHWEFAYGPEQFSNVSCKLSYPVLAINCYNRRSGELVFDPFTLIDIGGLRVGVIGIASNIVDKTMPPSYSEGLRFTLGREELPGYIKELKDERADIILAISHLGFPQESKMASEVEGVDVWLSAHTHNRLYKPVIVKNTIMIQSGCHGSFLGKLDLEIENRKIAGYSHRLITVDDRIPEDPEIEELVSRALDPHRDFLSRVVGETSVGLNRNTILESTMDNFVLQSIISLGGAEVAFSNGWRYGAPVPPGPITVNDLYNMMPTNPPVTRVNLLGKEIWQMMEENLEMTFSRDPYNQMGGYVKRCLGLNVYFKAENPPGTRVQEIFVQGKRLEPERSYRAVFLTYQAVHPKYGYDRAELDIKAIDAMEGYLAGARKANPAIMGSVAAV